MQDQFQRKIEYLRVSVTDCCNLRCRYCMPEHGVKKLRHADVLTYEEILRDVRALAALGVRKVRLTGGEPIFLHDGRLFQEHPLMGLSQIIRQPHLIAFFQVVRV